MIQALGWSLLHFLWQGTAAAIALASLNLLAKRATPQVRYVLASLTLLLMLLLPILTFRFLRGAAPPSGPTRLVAMPAGEGAGGARFSPGPAGESPTDEMRRRIEPRLPVLVLAWGAGVLIFSLRAAGGWALVQRLRRSGLARVPALEQTVVRLREALRVSVPVRLYQSALIQVPTVVGWLRPMILLPASAITGLSPSQLELILAHELAHIRRWDYLVNLMQTAVETLLFYHPAVWWVSHRMRVEREHCCDDLAVAAGGNAIRYARALADLGGLCSDAPALTMAATGGSLFERVARLVGPPQHLSRASRGLATVLIFSSLSLAMGVGSSILKGPMAPVAVASAAIMPPGAFELAASTVAEEAPRERKAAAKAETPPASPRSEPRAFPLERVLELAQAGVTPQFIDELDALGYSSLTVDQLLALRAQGVSPEYIRGLMAEGHKGLSADQLVGLRAQGVTPHFIAGLREHGLVGLSLSNLMELRAQGVTPEYVAEMKQAGYEALSVSQLIELRSQGVSGRYARELKSLGYDNLPLIKLIALRSQGVTPEYVREMGNLGYRGLELPILLGLRSQGVTPQYVRGLKEAGYADLPAGMLIELRSHGITPQFVREMREAGLDKLKPEELIELHSRGVRGELLKRLKNRL